MPRVWQIAGGPVSRSYAEEFLKYGVGLIGPGDAGKWAPDRPNEDYGGGSVRQFARDVRVGDTFLLRSGNSCILAVGVVASEYLYLTEFDDVNGWDLQHGRRVRWFRLPVPHDFGGPVFGASPARFREVSHPEVTDLARRLLASPPTDWQHHPLPPFPPEEAALLDIPADLADIIADALDFAGQSFGDRVSEDEILAHLAVPFFRALGWPPELIAVKWRYIDVALFDRLPRIPENCRLIVEAKYPGAGIEGALGQAQGYARTLNIPRDILVTDGFRYRLYSSERDYEPAAYANLLRLKQSAAALFARLRRSP
jgi:hypothetical protein